MKTLLTLCVSTLALFAAEPAQELVQLAKKSPQSTAFREKLMAQTKPEDRKNGRA